MDEEKPVRKPPTGKDFDRAFAAVATSPTLRRIWREAYGNDYSEEVEPYSFVTLTLLRRIAQELCMGPGQSFADLGCGRGGPGLWVARETGAFLVGIDFSRVAIEHATERAQAFGVADVSTFLQRDVAQTGLPDACLDGAMSVDVWLLLPDKPAAAREILRPGGRFVFTTWASEQPLPFTPPIAGGYPQLFREAGGVVETYEETPEWERRQRALYDGILAAQQALIAELGEAVAGDIIKEAQHVPVLFSHSTHILMVVRREVESHRELNFSEHRGSQALLERVVRAAPTFSLATAVPLA